MSNDTQHYTNLEIFRSLLPKLKAAIPDVNWDVIEKDGYKHFKYFIDAIAITYRSGYGRGQKGRSFLIGEKKVEPKQDKDSSKLVCWIGKTNGYYQPKMVGTIGKIDRIDRDNDVWVFWPAGSCDVHYCEANKKESWCCHKGDCLRIDTNVKGNVQKGDRIVYLGMDHGFLNISDVWPNEVATGVVDFAEGNGVLVNWDSPDVVGDWYNGRTHVWYEDIAKVIPWD